MGDPEPSRHGLGMVAPGMRVTVRRRFPDGFSDVVGFVEAVDADSFTVADRRGTVHRIRRADIVAGHPVPVARGRDPLRTPLAELDALALRAGITGRVLVARLSDLLQDRQPPATVVERTDAAVEGEWVSTAGAELEVAWWAARRGARSMQVRTDDATIISELLALGFVERHR
ncbi:MAG: hypothetical protein WCF12_03055 [Propionicimonas sp.]